MQLFLSGHAYRYECENLCRLFFPYSPAKVEEAAALPEAGLLEGPWAFARIEGVEGAYHYTVTVSDGERSLTRQADAPALQEYSMTNLLYNAFVELTGTRPAWGMLTGIHPVKLLRQYVEEQGEEAGARLLPKPLPRHRPQGRAGPAGAAGPGPGGGSPDGKRFQPVCVHPFLSHPVRVLLLCLPGYGAREKADGPLL